MELLELYKKLPKTNCSQCGEANCMAFALKASKLQAKLSACPFLGGASPEEQPIAPSVSTGSYEQVGDEIEKEAVRAEFLETAASIGGDYESGDGREAIRLKMLNEGYELRKDGLYRDNVRCDDPWTKIIICDYVRRKGSAPLLGEWITLGHFPHTASYVKAFQSNAEKDIAGHFRNDLNALRRRSAEMGGVAESGSAVKADYSCGFDLLPRVPLCLSFWAEDDEFDADCKLFVDRSAENYIDIEYLAYLLEKFAEELTSVSSSG